MIRRLIGTLVTLAVLAVVALTILHRDRFHSLLRFGEPGDISLSASDTLPVPVSTETAPEGDTESRARILPAPDSIREAPVAAAPADSSVVAVTDTIR